MNLLTAYAPALANPVPAPDYTVIAFFCFLLAAVMLDFFDVSLPRGDSVGVAGALSAAALVLVGPLRACLIVVASAVVAHVLRRGVQSPVRLAAVLASRGAGLLAGTLFLSQWRDTAPALAVYCLVPAIFLAVEMMAAQAVAAAMTSRPYLRLLRGNARSQAPVLTAEWSASALLLLTYGGMGAWSLVPVVALLILMRQSFALFLDIRETYRATVEVLVEAAESQDSRRAGHSDRTAATARSIAVRLGLNAAAVERISYAALLHDLGTLAEAPEIPGEPRPNEVHSADVIRDVDFFKTVEPVLRICDGTAGVADDNDLMAAMIVALASDIDAAATEEVAAAHRTNALAQVAPRVSAATKARVASAALALGYKIPAVG